MMPNRSTILFLLVWAMLTFSACKPLHSARVQFKTTAGKELADAKRYGFVLKFYGDYQSKRRGKATFNALHADYQHWLKSHWQKESTLLWAGETDLFPTYGIIAWCHKKEFQPAKQLLEVEQKARQDWEVSYAKTDSFVHASKKIYQFEHWKKMTNPSGNRKHLEYWFEHEGRWFQLLFWCTEATADSFRKECRAILETLVFTEPKE